MMDTRTVIPIPDAPLTNGDRITEVWFRFLLQIFNRTGGSDGGDLTNVLRAVNDLQALLAAQVPVEPTSLPDVPAEVVAASLIATALGRIQELEAQIQQVSVAMRSEDVPAEVYTHGTHSDGTLHAVATPTQAGFMSAADKTKLDSL